MERRYSTPPRGPFAATVPEEPVPIEMKFAWTNRDLGVHMVNRNTRLCEVSDKLLAALELQRGSHKITISDTATSPPTNYSDLHSLPFVNAFKGQTFLVVLSNKKEGTVIIDIGTNDEAGQWVSLGSLEVTKDMQLQQVQPTLVALMGGFVGNSAVNVTDTVDNSDFSEPHHCPFAMATTCRKYRLEMEMSTKYRDLSDRRSRRP